MADGQHTHGTGAWHYCDRCGEKYKLGDELQWQRGKLLCETCWDKKLIGDREVIIAQVLGDGKQEFALHPKLRHPATESDGGDITIAGI